MSGIVQDRDAPAVRNRGTIARELQRFDLILVALIVGLLLATLPPAWLLIDERTGGLDLVINTVTAVAAAAAAALAWVRWRTEDDPAAPFESAAFLVLFATRGILVVLAVGGLEPDLGLTTRHADQWPVYAWTLARLATAILLVYAASLELRPGPVASRPRAGVVFLGPLVAVLALLVLFAAIEPALPAVVESGTIGTAWPADMSGPAMLPAAIVIQLVVAGFYLWGAWLYRRLFRQRGRRYAAVLAVALVIAAFAQLHWAILPGIYAPVVTTDDVLRAAMSIVLLVGIEEQTRDDLRRLRTANTELEERRAAEAEQSEREAAVAREIHDGIAQELWLAKLKLARLPEAGDAGPATVSLVGEGAAAVDRALERARAAVTTIRTGSATPPHAATLADATADFAEQSGIRTEVTGELPPLPPAVRSEILLIVQEALANVRKHADATVVRVTVTSDGSTAVLTVADNGRGFATGEATGTGFGIRGMRERAALVSAGLEIISRPRDGTRVVVRLPR